MLSTERSCESRMREIRTSGSTRGEAIVLRHRSSSTLPLFSGGGLVNQLGTDEYSGERFFRRKINFWLRQVKALWPECPAHVSSDGNYLRIAPSNGPSPVKPRSATLAAHTPTSTPRTPSRASSR